MGRRNAPWWGVTARLVAVPDDSALLELEPAFACCVSSAVRSLFALDILALLFASPMPARTLPVATPIMPRPFVWSYEPTSSSTSPKTMRF